MLVWCGWQQSKMLSLCSLKDIFLAWAPFVQWRNELFRRQQIFSKSLDFILRDSFAMCDFFPLFLYEIEMFSI